MDINDHICITFEESSDFQTIGLFAIGRMIEFARSPSRLTW
jgi:hypothetical protein